MLVKAATAADPLAGSAARLLSSPAPAVQLPGAACRATLLLAPTAGFVGIGTSMPSAFLHVVEPGSTTVPDVLGVTGGAASGGPGGGISLLAGTSGANGSAVGFTGGTVTVTAGTGGTGNTTGAGGALTLNGGAGASGNNGAQGGAVNINGGAGGSGSPEVGGPGGAGGNIVLTPGAGGSGLSNGAKGIVSVSGNLTVTGSVTASSYITSSSRRIKTNILPLEGAMAKVQKLQGVSYDLKSSGEHQIGLIAEDVGKVIPDVVSYEKNGVDAQGVDYGRLTSLLIEATKEQQALIRKQKAEGQAQETEINGLRARLEAQQAQIPELAKARTMDQRQVATLRAQVRKLTLQVQELQKSRQSMAGLEARLARLEAGNKSNQTNAATHHTKKQRAGSLVAKVQF